MSQNSDALIKREIEQKVGGGFSGIDLRIFPSNSNFDQELFRDGGLTFSAGGVSYGSCDAAWTVKENWVDPSDGNVYKVRPILALEGTNALNTGSSGNAQYQRFHHVLGAVRCGVPGVYYLKKGTGPIRPELHGMAASASKSGIPYVITDDLAEVRSLLKVGHKLESLQKVAQPMVNRSAEIFSRYLSETFGSIEKFAAKRSTVLFDDYLVKHAGRMVRNFTESSQRAGHIAVGEMYLTKYLIPGKLFYYLFPRMTSVEIRSLDKRKADDKEWSLLRSEENVQIIGRDEIAGLRSQLLQDLKALSTVPLKGTPLVRYNQLAKNIETGLRIGRYRVEVARTSN